MCVTLSRANKKPTNQERGGGFTTKWNLVGMSLVPQHEPVQRRTTMSFPGHIAKGPSDQKTLNEELIGAVVEVARRNPQHAVELFGVAHGVATRLAVMPETQLD